MNLAQQTEPILDDDNNVTAQQSSGNKHTEISNYNSGVVKWLLLFETVLIDLAPEPCCSGT